MALSREAILAMPAGREMDVVVAQEIMQWDRVKFLAEFDSFIMRRTPAGEMEPLPLYSTNITAAWEIVDRLHMKRFTVQMEWHHRGATFVRVILPGEMMVDRATQGWESDAFPMPLAICRAALLARFGDERPTAWASAGPRFST